MPEHRDDSPTTDAALQNVFAALPANQKTAAFVGVVDIGQGNLNAVFNPLGQPFLYFDLGRGAGANQCSFPDPEPRLCYAGLKMVVQSHLDEDHYMAGALADVQAGIGAGGAPSARFVLPQQAMGNFAQAVKAGFLANNVHVYFWPLPNARQGNPALPRVNLPGTFVEIIKCNGGNSNNSGLALRIRSPVPGNQDWILLTADVHLRTDYFPWNDFPLPPPPPPPDPDLHMAGLVPSHHGARELQASVPRPPNGLTRSLVYSFGAGNNNGHPFNQVGHPKGDGVLSYLNQRWVDAGRLQTAGRPLDKPNFGPRSNIAILWPNAPLGPGGDSAAANDAPVAVALVATAAAAAEGAAAGAQSPRVPGAAAYQAALAYHVRAHAPVAAYIRQRGAPQAPIVAAATGMGALAAYLAAAINNNTAAAAADEASRVEPLARAAVKLGAAAAEAAAQQLTQQAITARIAAVGGVASQTNAARQAVFNQQAAGTPPRVQGTLAARTDHSAVPGLAFAAPSGIAIGVGGDPLVADAAYDRVVSLNYGNGALSWIAGVVRTPGAADGVGPGARFQRPTALLRNGNDLYVADTGNHTIRKIDLTNNTVTTPAGQAGVVGSADGNGNAARFSAPAGLAISGTDLYVVDTGNHTIRKIDLANGNAVTTIAGQAGVTGNADGNGNAARFNKPTGLAIVGTGLYVTDTVNHTIRKIDLANGNSVTTVAGQAGQIGNIDGNGNAARFNAPTGLTGTGRDLYAADTGNHTIRKIDLANGNAVTTVAGQAGQIGNIDGNGNAARFNAPTGLTVTGTELYAADTGNQTIRKIDIPNNNTVTTVAGQAGQIGNIDGNGNAARFNVPTGFAISGTDLYVADTGNHTIRKIDLANGNAVTTIAGQVGVTGSADGNGNAATFNKPTGLAIVGTGLYVTDTVNHTIRKIDLANGNAVTTVAGQAGQIGNIDGNGNAARFNAPAGLTVTGRDLYAADTGSHTIRKIDLANGNAVTTVAGQAGQMGNIDGNGNAARFNAPTGLAIVGTGLYVTDTVSHTIRKIDLANGNAVTTVAGQAGQAGNIDGNGNAARFSAPNGLAIAGTDLYAADTGNQTIRKIDLGNDNAVTTPAGQAGLVGNLDGNGNAARFSAPNGLAIAGTDLYVADTGNQTIRKIDIAKRNAVTVTATANGVVSDLVAENLLSFGRAAAAQPPPTVADVTALANTLSDNAAWAYCVAAANSPGRPKNDPTAGGVLRPGMSPVAAADAAVTAIGAIPIPYVEDGFQAALAVCGALGPAVEIQTTGVAVPGPTPLANRAEYERRLMVAAVAAMVGVRHGVGTIQQNVRASVAASRAAVAAARGGPIVGCHRHPSTCGGALCSLTLHEFIT